MLQGYPHELLFTVILFLILIVTQLIIRRLISKVLLKFDFTFERRKITVKVFNFFVYLLVFVALTAIWGIKRSDLLVFLTSVITVIGIAFFAQWSLLSNITAALILFFNHPLRLGDTIQVLDKEYPISGTVLDISFFFLHIQQETGERITIPNNLILQKTFSVTKKSK